MEDKTTYFRRLYQLREPSYDESPTHELPPFDPDKRCPGPSASSTLPLVKKGSTRINKPATLSSSGVIKATPHLKTLRPPTNAPLQPDNESAFVVDTSLSELVAAGIPAEPENASNPVPSVPLAPIPTLRRAASRMRKKRKRGAGIVLAPESERILKDLVFFYVPNDDVAPARWTRITRAREHGVTWARELSDQVTHIVVDKCLTYQHVLATFGPQSVPTNAHFVNENYPLDCIKDRFVYDPCQKQYEIMGYAREQSASTGPDVGSNVSLGSTQFLQLKEPQRNPKRWDFVPPKATPTASDDSSPMLARLVASEAPTENEPPLTRVDASNPTDDLTSMILEVKKIKHLPVSDDEDEGAGQPEQTMSRSLDSKRIGPRSRGPWSQDNFSCMKGGTGNQDSSNPNAHTISVLKEMAEYYSRIGDTWRPIAYRKAITALQNQKEYIKTAKEASTIPFIGARLAAKIEEISTTSRLRRLESALADPTALVLETFLGIYGVGTSTAARWVAQGHRTLQDLLDHVVLTPSQRIGIHHYKDFQTRIPRDEVNLLGSMIRQSAASLDPELECIIGGSYRRGASSSGDIDIIFTKSNTRSTAQLFPFMRALIDHLTTTGFLVAALTTSHPSGGSRWHGACVLPPNAQPSPSSPTPSNCPSTAAIWRRIDFLIVPATELGAALIYFTGNDIFNRSIRLLARKNGMRLNQRGLFRRGSGPGGPCGEVIAAADEKAIFDVLGVPWREPEERTC